MLAFTDKLRSFPSQIGPLFEANTTGIGLIVIVKSIGNPIQLFKVGITWIVATLGVVFEFKPEKLLIFPIPRLGKPMEGSELVHPNCAPEGVLEKGIVLIILPAQTSISAML